MNIHDLVDDLYEAFADRIGTPLSESARDLPRALRLAPEAVPWSRVFSHEITLGAPALFAEAIPHADPARLRDAVLAHLLAVVGAFGTDRIEDEQIEASPSVVAVLERASHERDRAMTRLIQGPVTLESDYRIADATTMTAIRHERAVLLAGRPTDFETYERASLDKQCVGVLASVALARASGWDDRRCRMVRAALESIWLGLQVGDDVVDWEDDLQRGGAWAVCLMKGRPDPANAGEGAAGARGGDSIRSRVLRSGVLGAMLDRARRHMGRARRRAAALGAPRLASWAAEQETRLATLAEAETRSAGYAVRAHALAAWATEVLS